MISLNDVIKIHEILIEKFGGKKGIRDIKLLQSALNRPFQTFEKKELYPSAIEKAAALLFCAMHDPTLIFSYLGVEIE